MVMPGLSGIQVLEQLKLTHPECEVILLTGPGDDRDGRAGDEAGCVRLSDQAVPLGRAGGADRKGLRATAAAQGERAAQGRPEPRSGSAEIIGKSAAMQEVFRLIERAGPTDKAILIQGESGTGKELVAKALQRASARADKPMVVINCAALPETLLESELFGHEKGSFTGAIATKQGLFEVADGGTLFIDEIGELAGSLQAKLLRVLEDGSMRRVGSIKERRVDVRLLAATNRDMEKEVAAGRFREDLYYRINVMSLQLPPLRERDGDIPLAGRAISRTRLDDRAGRDAGFGSLPLAGQHPAIDQRPRAGPDHGRRQDAFGSTDLPREVVAAEITDRRRPKTPTPVDGDHLAEIQRAHILEVLQRERGNKARAARALGVNRRSLYRLLEKYHIQMAEPGHGARRDSGLPTGQ